MTSRILDGRKFGKTADGKYRCNQCRKLRVREQMTRGGKVRQDCNHCAKRRSRLYAPSMTVSQRIDAIAREYPRKDPKPSADGPRVLFKLRSGNKKLGPIPMSISEPGTCPTSCAMHNVGCYAGYGWNGTIWRKTRRIGMQWGAFLASVRALPVGVLWRHNEAGDLAGDARGRIDIEKLAQLVDANAGRRGFTYTHRHPSCFSERHFVKKANARGFTINLSADSLEEADALADLGVAPVVVTIASDSALARWSLSRGPLEHRGFDCTQTNGGRKLVVCPAQTREMTCADCQLCAVPTRKSIIAFIAHGQGSALVSELVRSRRTAEVA